MITTEKALITIDAPELQEIEQSSAATIKATFEPFTQALAKFEDRYDEVIAEAKEGITDEVMIKAKQLRVGISKVRISAERVRKSQKEQSLRVGKAIDGVSNIIKWAVTDKENELKKIEDHFEIMERKRLIDLQEERVALLSPYVEDASERVLCDMAQDVWDIYLATKKKDHEDVIKAEEQAKVDAAKKAKEEAEERERLRQENEALKTQAGHDECIIESQSGLSVARAEEIDEYVADPESMILYGMDDDEWVLFVEEKKKIYDDQQTSAKAEVDKQAKHDAEVKAEQEKTADAESKLKANEDAEAKAKEDEEARVQADLEKGDAAKKRDLLSDLQALTSKYTFKSAKNQKMYSVVAGWINVIIQRVNDGEAK